VGGREVYKYIYLGRGGREIDLEGTIPDKCYPNSDHMGKNGNVNAWSLPTAVGKETH